MMIVWPPVGVATMPDLKYAPRVQRLPGPTAAVLWRLLSLRTPALHTYSPGFFVSRISSRESLSKVT